MVTVSLPRPFSRDADGKLPSERLQLRTRGEACAVNTMRVDDALAAIDAHITPLTSQRLPLDHRLLGRILAQDVEAMQNSPRFRMVAMDGYAVDSAMTEAACKDVPVLMPCVGPIPAGSRASPLEPGSAAPIGTGAPVPSGADAIIPRERTRADGNIIAICEPVSRGANVREIGEDIVAGARVLKAGSMITPEAIGALLSFGVSTCDVARRPAVAIVTTGNELRGRGQPSDDAGIVDSNGPMLVASCASLGIRARQHRPVPDHAGELRARIEDAIRVRGTDLFLSTGGVSAGDLDLVRSALEHIGARIVFHGVAMRPGKPILFALLPDGRPWFGLPGNPLAALVGFRFFVVSALRRMSGSTPEKGVPVAIAREPRADATQFLRARSMAGELDIKLDQRSHIFSSALLADTWIKLDCRTSGGGAERFPINPSLGDPPWSASPFRADISE